jgi:hypothetical protein
MATGSPTKRTRSNASAGRGAVVPADDDERHLPRARFHAELAHELGDVDAIEPLYLRAPDA